MFDIDYYETYANETYITDLIFTFLSHIKFSVIYVYGSF